MAGIRGVGVGERRVVPVQIFDRRPGIGRHRRHRHLGDVVRHRRPVGVHVRCEGRRQRQVRIAVVDDQIAQHRVRRGARVRQDGRRQARGRLGERVARVTPGQRRRGRQVDVHGHRRRRPGRAGHGDRRALHRARRNAQHGRAGGERPVHHRHRNVDRERRPREHLRPHLVGPHLLHRHGERQRIGRVAAQREGCQRRQAGEHPVGERIQVVVAQTETCQRRQAGEHPVGERIQIVALQIEKCQRRQAGEHGPGERIQLVVAHFESCQRGQAGEHGPGERLQRVLVQNERCQRGQAGEHVRGERLQSVVVQTEICQRRQAGEHGPGERLQRVVAQKKICQRGQAGEHVRGKHGEAVPAKTKNCQARQTREVARLQRGDVLGGHVQACEARQVGVGHRRAVIHPREGADDDFVHLLRAVADARGRRRPALRGAVDAEIEGVGPATPDRLRRCTPQARIGEGPTGDGGRVFVIRTRAPPIGAGAGGEVLVVIRHDDIGVSRLERCARRGGKARRDVLCDARRIGQGMQGTGRMARRIGGPDADAQRADIRGRNVLADEHLDRGERVVATVAGDRKALRHQVAVSHIVTDAGLGIPDIAHQHVGLRLGRGGEGEAAKEHEQRRGGERPHEWTRPRRAPARRAKPAGRAAADAV